MVNPNTHGNWSKGILGRVSSKKVDCKKVSSTADRSPKVEEKIKGRESTNKTKIGDLRGHPILVPDSPPTIISSTPKRLGDPSRVEDSVKNISQWSELQEISSTGGSVISIHSSYYNSDQGGVSASSSSLSELESMPLTDLVGSEIEPILARPPRVRTVDTYQQTSPIPTFNQKQGEVLKKEPTI